MKLMTVNELVETVKDMPTHTIGSVQTQKVETTNKKDRDSGLPFEGTITSETVYNPFLGLTYQKTVNNRLKAEGKEADFESGSLPYGEWYGEGHTVIKHNGSFQLRLTLCGANRTRKRYFLNGVETPKAYLPNVLPSKGKNKYANQGLDEGNEVVVVNVRMETIRRIALNGEEIAVIPN